MGADQWLSEKGRGVCEYKERRELPGVMNCSVS